MAEEMSVAAVFSSLALTGGDQLKSQSVFTEYYAGYGFFGGLSALSTDSMFALKLASPASLVLTGTPVSLPMAFTLSSGWTWMPMPYQTSVSLAAGLPSFDYQGGSNIKSQSTFSEYYDGYGWFGTLTTLEPGVGYRIKVPAGGPTSFEPQR